MTLVQAVDLPAPPTGLLQGASLFLDFDGTLVEIAARPDAVLVTQQVHDLLGRLNHALGGRVAIVSGRTAADIGTLLKGIPVGVGGSHGAELYWSDGRSKLPAKKSRPNSSFLGEIAALRERHPDILVEEKPFGLALHYRQAPHAEAEIAALAGRMAVQTGLALQTGKKVIELRPQDADKGKAVASFMAALPMANGRPVFLGDDDTDEAGFAVAAALGGAGVLVGPLRPTAARYRLDSVDHALQWLEQALGAA